MQWRAERGKKGCGGRGAADGLGNSVIHLIFMEVGIHSENYHWKTTICGVLGHAIKEFPKGNADLVVSQPCLVIRMTECGWVVYAGIFDTVRPSTIAPIFLEMVGSFPSVVTLLDDTHISTGRRLKVTWQTFINQFESQVSTNKTAKIVDYFESALLY